MFQEVSFSSWVVNGFICFFVSYCECSARLYDVKFVDITAQVVRSVLSRNKVDNLPRF